MNWQAVSAAGTWVYTLITGVILGVSVYQAGLIAANNVVSGRAFVSVAYATLIPNAIVQATDPEGNLTGAQELGLGFPVLLVNNGGTPTKNLRAVVDCEPFVNKPLEPWDALKQHKLALTPISLGAHSSTPEICGFTNDQLKKMYLKQMYGYVVGKVIYRDRIDASIEHVTEYAVAVIPVIQFPVAGHAPPERRRH
jgi:hypothetical protein